MLHRVEWNTQASGRSFSSYTKKGESLQENVEKYLWWDLVGNVECAAFVNLKVSRVLKLTLPFLSSVSFRKTTPFLWLFEIKLSLNVVYVEQKEKNSGPYWTSRRLFVQRKKNHANFALIAYKYPSINFALFINIRSRQLLAITQKRTRCIIYAFANPTIHVFMSLCVSGTVTLGPLYRAPMYSGTLQSTLKGLMMR